MKRRSRWPIATLLLLILGASLVAKEPPRPPAPKPDHTASLDKSGNLLVNYIVQVPVVEERAIKKDHQEITVKVTRLVPEYRTMLIVKGHFQVFDSKGKRVGPMALPQLLKTKKVMLVTGDGMKPTEQIKKLDDDTLLVVNITKKPAPKTDGR